MAKYYCKHCKKTVERLGSNNKRIKSYCDTVNKTVYLTKVDNG